MSLRVLLAIHDASPLLNRASATTINLTRDSHPTGQRLSVLHVRIAKDMTLAGTASQPGSEDPIEVAFRDVPRAIGYILASFTFLAIANYYVVARNRTSHIIWSIITISFVVFSHFYATVDCRPFLALRNCALFCCVMKCLDMLFRYFQNISLVWKLPNADAKPPPLYQQAFWMTLELRYEDFLPNPVRQKLPAPFHEPTQLLYHTLFYLAIAYGPIPQFLAPVKAVKLLLQIYILWTAAHLPFRLSNTTPFFSPLYKADSLVDFWNGNIWHVAFQSPCQSIAYMPVQTILKAIGLPKPLARGSGVVGAFTLMGIFHAYIGWSVMTDVVDGWTKVVGFFMLNGVATVFEDLVWGRKKSWVRAMLAWVFEISLASWAVSGVEFPYELWLVHDPRFCHITVF
ncbi:hypothetical protein H072_7558 [Dactylellina haptotyla CBS 200.50]|uniref:Wax synthase domain-containing protein n=1 Tax=Dactylellina haptotyla (strain CBS 200.50) TaxID=1284197 RepID=S8BHB5_DACHA|nr:hypothetical protein H072_7558 [Dactylellina haptotyla CBS 200.50]